MTTDEQVVDVSQDWALACNVQRRFMQGGSQISLGQIGLGQTSPDRISDTVDYSARCRQVRALGGDCYDFMPLAENRLALVVGDASGKGLAAALMMANVQSSLRTAAMFTGDDLAGLLKVVNHQAHTSSLADRYATVFYGVFDAATRTLRYVNAGHNPPAVLRRNGAIDWLRPGGAPVGMFPDSTYEESIVQLDPGDVVVAYTDGVIDAENPASEEWGVEGLLRAASAPPQCVEDAEDLVQSIVNSMDDFSGGRQTDDATVVILRVI